MLQINVAQLLKSALGSMRNYDIDEVVYVDGDLPIKGEVTLIRVDRGILVQSRLCTDVTLTCSRCLRGFSYPLTLEIEEEFYPTTDIITGAMVPLPDEPGCFTIDEHNILDLGEAIRQYALMAIPMKPLCREDCAGLCPSCGHNLNETSCACPPKTIDTRWSKLASLVSANNQSSLNQQKGTN